jgi:hypothetical protein
MLVDGAHEKVRIELFDHFLFESISKSRFPSPPDLKVILSLKSAWRSDEHIARYRSGAARLKCQPLLTGGAYPATK